MRHFPTFFDLQNKPVAVIGGTAMALQRSRLLLEAGARITIFARTLHPELAELALDGQDSLAGRELAARRSVRSQLAFVATGDAA